MSCELGCDDLKDVGFEELIRKMVVLTEDGCYALRVIDEGAGVGGSYTFPTNHGNTAYVSVDGNDATGVVGNISKPFENIGDAIIALDNTLDGVIIILSSTSAQVINDYDYTTMPYNLSIFDFANTGLACGGSCSFGALKVRTAGIYFVSTDFLYTSDEICDIECDTLLINSTAQGAITFRGKLECNVFSIPSNANNPSLEFDNIIWKRLLDVNEPITYTRCNPMVWKGVLNQADTDAPTATVFENTFGETLTFSYQGTADYHINSPGGKFTTNTLITNPNNTASMSPLAGASLRRQSTTVIQVSSYDSVGSAADSQITDFPVTIESYP